MYAVTSMPPEIRTLATLRSAEFGFFGVVVYTRVHTPRRCGLSFSAAVLVLATLSSRPLRTSCWIVGMNRLLLPVWRLCWVSTCSFDTARGLGWIWCARRVAGLPWPGNSVPRGRACRPETGSAALHGALI